MRVLMTTDAVGGVWQYSLALARGLVARHGCRVCLVCLGEPAETDLPEALPNGRVELISLKLKLEWMPDSAADVKRAVEEIRRLVSSWGADLVHSNQFCFGLLDTAVPTLVVAHSDISSWIAWHRHGGEAVAPDDLGDLPEGYRKLVAAGLAGASAIVCPSRFMARALEESYGWRAEVIHNGLWPEMFPEQQAKADVAVVAGRLWDEAKRAATAVHGLAGLPTELRLVGPTVGPCGETALLPTAGNVRYLGSRTWRETRAELARARFYLATSAYEPFGLAALEAAFSGCALLANDIPSHRELWEGAALFYRRDDAADLRARLAALLQDPAAVHELASAAHARAHRSFTADRMAADYYRLYEAISRRQSGVGPWARAARTGPSPSGLPLATKADG